MSIECAECERDVRGGHDESCSRYPVAMLMLLAEQLRTRSGHHVDLTGYQALAKHVDGVIERSRDDQLPGVPWQVNADVRELLATAEAFEVTRG